jgi:hypothetical protein
MTVVYCWWEEDSVPSQLLSTPFPRRNRRSPLRGGVMQFSPRLTELRGFQLSTRGFLRNFTLPYSHPEEDPIQVCFGVGMEPHGTWWGAAVQTEQFMPTTAKNNDRRKTKTQDLELERNQQVWYCIWSISTTKCNFVEVRYCEFKFVR